MEKVAVQALNKRFGDRESPNKLNCETALRSQLTKRGFSHAVWNEAVEAEVK